MIAVDTNVLVYAHRREASEHVQASAKLVELATGDDSWAIPWPCVYEFLSVVTNRRIWKDAASTQEQAWAQLEAWFGSPSLRPAQPPAGEEGGPPFAVSPPQLTKNGAAASQQHCSRAQRTTTECCPSRRGPNRAGSGRSSCRFVFQLSDHVQLPSIT